MVRPMLSIDGTDQLNNSDNKIPFPCIAQIKFDGFRCIIPNGIPMSRTLKPIPNMFVRNRLINLFGTHNDADFHPKDHPLNGFDGELIALDPETSAEGSLHYSQSRLNRYTGFPRFVFHVFDDFTSPDQGYTTRKTNLDLRLKRIRNHVSQAALERDPERITKRIHDHVFQIVESRICERIEDILEFEAECLAWGAEGIILRKMDAPYKFGRSTLNEFASVKIKRFMQDEAVIIGFTEKMTNNNPAITDERGYSKRASNKENLVPANTLGTMILQWGDIVFEIGTGWDADTAKEIWMNRKNYIGKTVTFNYKDVGPNGKPLISSFIAVRYDK